MKDDDVLDARMALSTLHLGDIELGDEIAPRGVRLLRRVSKLTPDVATKIVDRFGGLARLQRATIDDLAEVDGVDTDIAESVKETLERVTENTILGQYN